MATIEKRPGGKYRIKVYMGENADGKAVFKSKTVMPEETTPAKIKKELEMLALKYEEECKKGKTFDGDKMKFCEFYEEWYKECSDKLSPAERESNKANIERVFFPEIGNLPMNSITPLNIQRVLKKLMKDRGLSAKTVRKYYSQLSPIFKKAFQWRIIETNPCSTGMIDLPSISKDREATTTFEEGQVERFLAFCSGGSVGIYVDEKKRSNGRVIPAHVETYQIPYQNYLLFTLACYTGLRRGELLALTWNDIDLNACMIHVRHSASHAKEEGGRFVKGTKTESGKRDVPLPSMLLPILKEWKRMEKERMETLGSAWKGERQIAKQPLFIQDNGKPMYKDTPCKSFEKAIRLYNLTVKEAERIPETITLHGCRHYYGSMLIAKGVPVSTVSRLMGHANVSVTMEIYLHDVKPTEETRSLIDSIFKQPQEEVSEAPAFLG